MRDIYWLERAAEDLYRTVTPKQPYILPYRDVEADNRIEILVVMHASQEWPASFRRNRQR